MNIPNKIKIGSLNYTVELTDNIKFGLDSYGECFSTDLEIRIRKSIPEQRQKFALIHECLHAIYDNLGLHNVEEQHIHKLGAAIHQLIEDNPNVFLEKGEMIK